DLNATALPPLDRPIYFVNVMYAPGIPGQGERFPNRLPGDLFHEAIIRLKDGTDATAPSVIIVNASLGDRNKPFTGHMSGWARVLDYLSYQYGVLFVVSAGNQFAPLKTDNIGTAEFEQLGALEKAKTALQASGQSLSERRILAPAESVNSLTVVACTVIVIRYLHPCRRQRLTYGRQLASVTFQAPWDQATAEQPNPTSLHWAGDTTSALRHREEDIN